MPRLLELTVTTAPDPAHGEVAVGEVKLLRFGFAFTVMVAVTALPQPFEKVIFAVPAVPLVTWPAKRDIDATPGLLLLQVPLLDASLNVVVDPLAHKGIMPVIGAGMALTVIG